jgi:MFS family permease
VVVTGSAVADVAAGRPAGRRPGRGGLATTLAFSMGIGPLLVYGLTATGPLVIADLGLSRTAFGALATLAFAVAAVASGVLGRQVDRHGERAVLSVLFCGAGAALLVAAAAQSYAWLCVAVALSGCVQSLSNPVTNRLVTAHAAPGSRGVLMGVKQSGVQMAQFAAGIALPSLALVVGWRGALGLSSVLALVGLLLALRHVPPRPATRGAEPSPQAGHLPGAVWWLAGYALLTGAALQASNVYLPLFGYEALDLPVAVAGLTAGVVGGVGLVGRIAWGRAADRMSSPQPALVWLAAVAALGAGLVLAAGALHWAWLLWVGAAVFGASGIPANVVVMLAVVHVSPRHVVGRASGLLAVGLYLGFAVGPVSFGALVDSTSSYVAGWVAVASAYLAAAGLALLWRRSAVPAASAAGVP